MTKNTAKKSGRTHASLLTKLLILLLLAGIGMQLLRLQEDVKTAEAEKALLAAQVEAQQQENDALTADITEGGTQEKMEELAREELGLVYPGERVFFDTSN